MVCRLAAVRLVERCWRGRDTGDASSAENNAQSQSACGRSRPGGKGRPRDGHPNGGPLRTHQAGRVGSLTHIEIRGGPYCMEFDGIN